MLKSRLAFMFARGGWYARGFWFVIERQLEMMGDLGCEIQSWYVLVFIYSFYSKPICEILLRAFPIH